MRCKYKLSFSIFMISSCVVQSVNAGENKTRSLTRMTSGTTVQNGSALISATVSSNAKIEDGGVEIVENGGSSVGAIVQKGGMQIVTRGGTAMKTKILSGWQFVYEDKSIVNLEDFERKSSAYDAIVSGENGFVGQQNVYDGATAWNTEVGKGGEQNLYMGPRKDGGIAERTIVSGNGRQHILEEGRAVNTTLSGQAIQVVYPGGIVDGLTITETASSWIHVGADLNGEIKVNGNGRLYLYAGDRTNHITKGKLSIQGRSDEIIFSVGTRNNMGRDQVDIESLSGQGGTVIFMSAPYDQRHIYLNVAHLSGNLHFHFNLSKNGDRIDYLSIDSGIGNHKISVADSGSEIIDSLSQKNGVFSGISLITDRSQGEGPLFTLANHSGQDIGAVDGGTFMYTLRKRERSADSSGDATIWYLGMATGESNSSSISLPRTTKRQKTRIVQVFSTSGADKVMQPRQKSSNGKNKKPTLPKERLPRHLRESQQDPVLSTASSPEDQIIGATRPDVSHQSSDEKQQPAVSVAAQSLADQMFVRPSDQDQPSLQSIQELSVSDFLTTPSTDAVLSMSVTPGLIFHNELQTVRAGRGIIDKNKENVSLWTYAIKSKESVATEHLDFKLDQTGIVLGVSGLSELTSGAFYIGGFGSYDQARVAHARGGISGINTYSIGAYATYFDHSGLYLDSVVKYNQYQTNLKAISTNGLAIEGNYNQWAVGTSFEAGYRFKMAESGWMQPYANLTWLQVEGKEIKLSNEMTGDISPFSSLRSEVGLSLGYEFGSGMGASSLAYITAAWLRENKDNNHTTINQQHKFTTDLSGNAGKFGVGLSSFVSDKLKLYAEAHYVKGRKTKQSLQGILGVRYSF
ncbi:BafA family autotransporter [Bartonella gliris]|uniref:BafA family autotransporter n=1 Tax=Bartonella gliris TaxID=3004109 RepID=UPI003872D04A